MSWEDVDRSFDHTRPEDITIVLDLAHFGELVGRVASEYARVSGMPQFDPHTEEARHLMVDAWRYVCHMADRAKFEKSVREDLQRLENLPNTSDAPSDTTNPVGTQHLPEFGGAARPHSAPDELNRRLEPPV